MKDSNISEIENTSCVRNVMEVTTVSKIERASWRAASILRRVNYGVFICTCNVKYDEYDCCTKHAFVYDSHFKPLYQTKCCGVLIYNRVDAPIYVFEDKDRETKKKLRHSLKEFFGGLCHVEYVYRITPCWFIVVISI